jgi:hypothetical protein
MPKKHETTGSVDLFRARLEQIINMKHELVLLAGKIEWQWIDSEIAPLYSDKGRPGIETRFVRCHFPGSAYRTYASCILPSGHPRSAAGK